MSTTTTNKTDRQGCRCETTRGESAGCACGQGCRCAPCECGTKKA